MKKYFSIVSTIVFVCMLVCLPNVYAAEKYPQQTITVYHPFGPTPYDVLSEVYNEELSKILNVPVKFEYGMRGKAAQAVLKGQQDGYTVFFAAMGPMVLMPNMIRPAYRPEDFKAIGRATLLPIIFVAEKNAPYKTFDEFIAYAKKNPGKTSIGLTNFPSSLHIGMTHFIKDIAKLDVKLVEQPDGPIRGTIDCLIGETDALISHTPDIMRYIKRGDFIPLATFAEERLEMLPDVPTLKEKGYDFSQTSWRVLVVNKDTPQEIVDILARASKAALENPRTLQSAKENYEVISWLSPEDADKFLQDEFKFYEDLSKSMGLHYSQKKK